MSDDLSTQVQAIRDARRTRARSRRRGTFWIVLGILILLTPIVLTLINDYQLNGVAQRYSESVEHIKPQDRTRAYLEEAEAYNEQLAASGHHAMPPRAGSPGFEEYLSTLDAPETNGVMARVRIPDIQLDLPIYHTTNSEVLYRGVGHMFGSDLPVGGVGRTSVISAHTGMMNASMFDQLVTMENGKDIYIDVMGEQLRYQVTGRKVVGPSEVSAITYEADKDKLVLITCTPYGINTDRLLVEAQRVPVNEPGLGEQGWSPVFSWWMILDLILILAVIIYLIARRRRERRKEQAVRARESASMRETSPEEHA